MLHGNAGHSLLKACFWIWSMMHGLWSFGIFRSWLLGIPYWNGFLCAFETEEHRRVIAYPNERLLGSWVSFRTYRQHNYTLQSGLHCARISSYSWVLRPVWLAEGQEKWGVELHMPSANLAPESLTNYNLKFTFLCVLLKTQNFEKFFKFLKFF